MKRTLQGRARSNRVGCKNLWSLSKYANGDMSMHKSKEGVFAKQTGVCTKVRKVFLQSKQEYAQK
jgi:hypothetical protein